MNDNNNNDYNNIERIWAYLKLQQFEINKSNKNKNKEEKKNNDKTSPLSIAIKYKFVTSWTSMIVVKQTK